MGELAVIYDRKDQFLAVGLFDPDSPIRVRILHVGKPQTVNRAWWSGRLNQALEKRRGLFDIQTTGYRCINGESDGWPGLVLDRYGDTLVLKLYTAAWLPHLDEIIGLIQDSQRGGMREPAQSAADENRSNGQLRIVLRLSRNSQKVAEAQFKKIDGQIPQGPALVDPVIFLARCLRFHAAILPQHA